MMAGDKPKAKKSESEPQPSAHEAETIRNAQEGLTIAPVFCTGPEHPFDQTSWEKRSARIGAKSGETIFEQLDVDVPADWSQMATDIVISKYFYGETNTITRIHPIMISKNKL